jgi:hypothetical protein
LRRVRATGTMEAVDDPEATQVMLETLIDIRSEVHDLHVAILGEGDDEEETEEDT